MSSRISLTQISIIDKFFACKKQANNWVRRLLYQKKQSNENTDHSSDPVSLRDRTRRACGPSRSRRSHWVLLFDGWKEMLKKLLETKPRMRTQMLKESKIKEKTRGD